MSNTRKMTANRKNRSENGIRAEFRGSNPHSKGDSFSRSWWDRAARAQAIEKISRVSRDARKREKSARSIWCGYKRRGPIFRVKI